MNFDKWQRAVEELARKSSPGDLAKELASLFNKIYPDGPHISASGKTFFVSHIADPDALLVNPYEAARAAMREQHAAARSFAEAFHLYDEATFTYEDTREEVVNDARIWVPNVEQELIEYFKANPECMYSMAPRKFEELIAAILRNNGFDVELMPYIKDGGIDIIAVQGAANTSERVILVECKRYAHENRVGLGIVQRLLGVVFDVRNQGNYGMLVTTSTFTNPAIECAEANSHVLSLRDYFAIVGWLNRFHIII